MTGFATFNMKKYIRFLDQFNKREDLGNHQAYYIQRIIMSSYRKIFLHNFAKSQALLISRLFCS